MAIGESPPFGRGETFYQGGTIDSANLGGLNLEGQEFEFADLTYNVAGQVGAKPARTNRKVVCRVVRNVSGIALLPGRLGRFQASGVNFGARIDGYTTVTADGPAVPIDEWLPAAGVPNNDLFYVVMRGPAGILTDLAGGANNVFSVGSMVVALTAATSQATTAGRIAAADLTGATAPLANPVLNRVGYALSAATTSQSNLALLVEVTQKL